MKNSRLFAFAVLVISMFAFSQRVSAGDNWIKVRSKNFLLIGDASEKDIRKVATRLEQFREVLRLVFTGVTVTSPIPTNVIVFKSDSAYRPFKPKHLNGKADDQIAGYFLPGEDVNYITLSTDTSKSDPFQTIFHEYTHFIVNTNFGKQDVPTWFNEGLAEYYETFDIQDDQKIKLGVFHQEHVDLLQRAKFLPLDQLFKASNEGMHESGENAVNIFYAESWALVHYLISNNKGSSLAKFLVELRGNVPQEKAFQDAFQMNYAQMESELRKYIANGRYAYTLITLNAKLTFDADMKVSPLDEADTAAYLGDLLSHSPRADDAESYLQTAIRLKPDSTMANTALGMLRTQQRKYAEAEGFLGKAIAADQTNAVALYRYAYVISRENMDEFGYTKQFPPDATKKMRDALANALTADPTFTPSYELVAFIDLVNNDKLDEAIAALRKALNYQPGNQRLLVRTAEILMRQNKLDEASALAAKIAATATEPEIRSRAASIVSAVDRRRDWEKGEAERKKEFDERSLARGKGQNLGGIDPDDPLVNMRAINGALRKPLDGETRVLGSITKIDCHGRAVFYTVKLPAGTIMLTSTDFDSLVLGAYVPEGANAQVGCSADIGNLNAVITYKRAAAVSGIPQLISIEFVSNDFRFLDPSDQSAKRADRIDRIDSASTASPLSEPPPPERPDQAAAHRAAIIRGIREAINPPAAGQSRSLGFLQTIECGAKGSIFVITTGDKTYRLLVNPSAQPSIGIFVADLAGLRFSCGIKPIEYPAVFDFTPTDGGKGKTDGEIVSLEFVPKDFTLQ